MRHYEIVLLIHPDQSEQVPAMLERYKDMVTAEKGLVHRVEDWGRRRLAYTINEVHKAHYVMLNVECGLETLRELEKNFKFNDSIVRNLVIRRDRAISEQSALAKAKAEEDRVEADKQAAQDKLGTGGKPALETAKVVDDAEQTADAEQDKQAAQDKLDTGGKPALETAKVVDDAEQTADAEQEKQAVQDKLDTGGKPALETAKVVDDAEQTADAEQEKQAAGRDTEQVADDAKPEPQPKPETV